VKAVRAHEHGGPEVLRYEDVPDPTPGPGEALVEMQYIGVNYSDTHYRRGSHPSPAQQLPLIPGHEGGGVVQALGDGVTNVQPGDRVVFSGQHRLGTYKELMTLRAADLVAVPADLDMKLAVAAMNQAGTAHYLVHDARPLKPGERVLVQAAAGGVGSNLVQMAKRAGAQVFATVSTEEKAEFVRGLGADEVIRYTETDLVEEVRRLTNGEGVDVVFDAVGGEVLLQSLRCIASRGHVVTYGESAGPPPPVAWPHFPGAPRSFFLSNHTGADYNRPGTEEAIARADEFFRWVQKGELTVHIHREYPLAEARQAHADIESRSTIGKLILIP
jgi:NADPH:quinone reductase